MVYETNKVTQSCSISTNAIADPLRRSIAYVDVEITGRVEGANVESYYSEARSCGEAFFEGRPPPPDSRSGYKDGCVVV